jgi:hypothetical protein
MNSKIFKNLIVFCCVFLVSAGLTTNANAKEETSVLSRIQKIDDPELGELIRIALENLPETKELKKMDKNYKEYESTKRQEEEAKLKTVSLITIVYGEIKLLDTQIEQINKKINSSSSPETLSYELILAKAELETKLSNKIAELRNIMHIIPIHPLGRRPIEQLNSWIKLDVIGEQVAVFTCSKPFREIAYQMKHDFVKLMSLKEAFDYVTNNVKELPIRIDILRNTEGIKISDELNKQIIDLIKKANLEMESEVHLDDEIRTQSERATLFIQNGKIGSNISTRYQRIDNRQVTIRELSGILDSSQVDETIRIYSIRQPEQLPVVFYLLHDEESKDLALSLKEKINNFAQKNSIEKLVTVKMEIYNLEDEQ